MDEQMVNACISFYTSGRMMVTLPNGGVIANIKSMDTATVIAAGAGDTYRIRYNDRDVDLLIESLNHNLVGTVER